MVFIVSFIISGMIASWACGADEVFSASRTIQVVTEQADLFLGKESRGRLLPGRVYRYTAEQDGWLFVPRRRGWVHRSHVLPLEESEAYFTTILAKAPQAEAYHHRAIARHALGEAKRALEDLNEAIRLKLNTEAVFVNRGNAWLSLGNPHRAIADYERALQIDETYALAYNNRALAWAALGKLDRAQQDATQAIRLDSTFAEAYNNRGVIHRQRGEFHKAVSDYTQALRHFTSFAEALANRGYARARLGEPGGALKDYQQAIAIAPHAPQAYNDAAWLLATCPQPEFRDGEQAVQYAAYACELTDFKNGEFVDTLAAAYAENGEFDDAVRTQQQANTLLGEASQQAAQERLRLYQQEQPYRTSN